VSQYGGYPGLPATAWLLVSVSVSIIVIVAVIFRPVNSEGCACVYRLSDPSRVGYQRRLGTDAQPSSLAAVGPEVKHIYEVCFIHLSRWRLNCSVIVLMWSDLVFVQFSFILIKAVGFCRRCHMTFVILSRFVRHNLLCLQEIEVQKGVFGLDRFNGFA